MTARTWNEIEPAVVRRAKAGDAEAFAALYAEFWPAVRVVVARMTGDEERAKEIAQEVFLRAWLKLPRTDERIDGPGKFRAWLLRIARHAGLDEVRHRAVVEWMPWDTYLTTHHPSHFAEDDTEEYAERRESSAEARSFLRPFLAQLSPIYREVLWTTYGRGLTQKEAAVELGRSWVGVKTIRDRARKRVLDLAGAGAATASSA